MIAPARTGSDNNRRNVVTNTDHTNKGRRSKEMPGARILIIVVMKFMDARIEEAPAKCSENIARSTDPPACAMFLDKGG